MKKSILFLFLALTAGLSSGAAVPDALAPASSQAQNSADDPSPQAMCKSVEVQIDEGYGVSGQETRLVCEEMP